MALLQVHYAQPDCMRKPYPAMPTSENALADPYVELAK